MFIHLFYTCYFLNIPVLHGSVLVYVVLLVISHNDMKIRIIFLIYN